MTATGANLALAADNSSSGSGILYLFYFVEILVLIGTLVARRKILNPRPAAGSTLRQSEPHEAYLAAYLNGGPRLALLTVLAHLRAEGLVEGHNLQCVRVDEPADPDRPRLERAVLAELDEPAARHELANRPRVVAAMTDLRTGLVRRGLLFGNDQRKRLRRAATPAMVLTGLGWLRLVNGGFSAAAFLPLVPLILVVFYCQGFVPARTRLGKAVLRRLSAEHRELHPKMKPSWTAHGPLGAAFAVALFGSGALWSADPVFANDLAAPRAMDPRPKLAGGGWNWDHGGGGDGGGVSVGSCGGGSGCGGGSCGGGSCGGGGSG